MCIQYILLLTNLIRLIIFHSYNYLHTKHIMCVIHFDRKDVFFNIFDDPNPFPITLKISIIYKVVVYKTRYLRTWEMQAT